MYGAFTLSGRLSQNLSITVLQYVDAVRTPGCTHPGLGSSAFARRYSRNRCFFLFLRVLRCFSSPGSLCMAMDSPYSDRGLLCRVSPFRYRRVYGYLLLSAAFRSLSRLSSALSAKASTLRSYSLDFLPPSGLLSGFLWKNGLSSLNLCASSSLPVPLTASPSGPILSARFPVLFFSEIFRCLVNNKWLFIISLCMQFSRYNPSYD